MTIITRSTPLIETETQDYPLYLADVVSRVENLCLPPNADSALLKELGYEVVNNTDRPEGDVVVVEDKPEKINDEWYRTWRTRPLSEEEKDSSFKSLQDTQKARISTFQNQEFAKGFPYQVGDKTYHVQVRISDRGNIDSLRTLAKEAKDNNDTDWNVDFRVYENVTINLDAQQMLDLANTTFVQVASAYKRVWDFKDAVDNATSVEDFPLDYSTLFNE